MGFRAPIFSGSPPRAVPLAVGSMAAGLFLVAGVLVAAPAIGDGDDNGGQPPPGTSVPKTAEPGPVITQPPPGTSVPKTAGEQPAGVQPANPDPDLEGAATQLKDDEPHARHYRNQIDEGTGTSGPDLGD